MFIQFYLDMFVLIYVLRSPSYMFSYIYMYRILGSKAQSGLAPVIFVLIWILAL